MPASQHPASRHSRGREGREWHLFSNSLLTRIIVANDIEIYISQAVNINKLQYTLYTLNCLEHRIERNISQLNHRPILSDFELRVVKKKSIY